VLCKAAESTGSAVQSMQLLHALQPQCADPSQANHETNPSQANHETNPSQVDSMALMCPTQ